jgi:uncharacterized protein (DUF111 family)
MRIAAAGYGAGGHDFPEHANVLRILLGEPLDAAEATTIDIIEANIDDLSPQVLGYAMERLLEAGALDVTLQSVEMKKGRPGVLLRVLTEADRREALAELIFAETSTLGLRIYRAERRVQARRWEEVETPYGRIRVKIGSAGQYAPEYEDCRRAALASRAPLKDVIAEAGFAYLKQTR